MKTKEFEQLMKLNLQFFADGGEGDGKESGEKDGTGEGDGGEDDEGGEDDDDGEEEKKFTQKDIDEAVKKRLERERRKWKRQQEGKADGPDTDKGEDKGKSGDEEKENYRLENEKLATKILCLEQGVPKENVDDVVALATAYIDDDNDMEDAIEKVLRKYPQFARSDKKDADEDGGVQNKSWGKRQEGSTKRLSGVEEAFYRKNPGLKPQ